MKIKVGEYISILQRSEEGRAVLNKKIGEQKERRYSNREIVSDGLSEMSSMDYESLRRYQMAKLFQYYKDKNVKYVVKQTDFRTYTRFLSRT